MIYSNNRYKTKDMNLNIKGIINLDFRGFKSGKELYEFSKNGDNFDTLANVWSTEDENTIINYETLYEKFDEIWVLNNYIIAKRTINSDEIIINPDFTRYLLENSFNYLEGPIFIGRHFFINPKFFFGDFKVFNGINVHHIISDGWSLGGFLLQLNAAYIPLDDLKGLLPVAVDSYKR